MRSSRRPKKPAAERAAFTLRSGRELASAARWIATDNPSAARALRDAVYDAAERLARHPELGRVRPDVAKAPYRILVLTGFPYLIVYDPTPTPPRIVRIVHGARDLPDVLEDL